MSVIVSDMYSVVLDAGVQAAIAAGSTGPSFNITGFQIGSLSAAEGAVANASATGVDNWQYTGTASQIYYALLPDSDACLFRIILDESVGNFQVGQICLMIGSTAFSKSVLYQRQNKWKSALPGLYGNSISFDIVLAISDAQACINLTMMQSLYARLPEVADETFLPPAHSSLYNCYLVRNHTALGIPVVATTRNNAWYFSPHRTTAAQGEGVLAVPPALFDPTVQINMAVYFDYGTGFYLPADPTDETKFPVGVRTSECEITQIGYVNRFGAGTADDIWPTTLTVNSMYSIQTGTPGIPGLTPTYQPYGVALSNNLIYIDMVDKRGESWLNQAVSPAGVQPLDQTHKHVNATEALSGFMSAADKLKLNNPVNFVIGGNGITTTALSGGRVSVTADGTEGFPIAPDSIGAGVLPGAPVCLQVSGPTRTWINADPSVPSLRPIGILNNDSTHIILSGEVTITATVNAWPEPLTPNSVYYAGESGNAGKVEATGDWIIGSAVTSNTIAVNFEPIASVLDHKNALIALHPIVVKNASPGGVRAMFDDFHTEISDPVTGFLPLSGGTMTGFAILHADPTIDLHAATKHYVDNHIPSSIIISNVTKVFIPQTTWYVDFTSGSDTTGDGLTTGTAWKTIQHAVDTISTQYMYSGAVVVKCADGTHTTAAGTYTCLVSPSLIGTWEFIGNEANPSACVIDASAYGSRGFCSNGAVAFRVSGFTISSYLEAAMSGNGATIVIGTLTLYSSSGVGNALTAVNGGLLTFSDGAVLSVSGSYNSLFAAENGASLGIGYADIDKIQHVSIAFVGGTAFATACAASSTGNMMLFPTAASITGGGNVSGVRYKATVNGYISVLGAGINVFPGTSPGVTTYGGLYLP